MILLAEFAQVREHARRGDVCAIVKQCKMKVSKSHAVGRRASIVSKNVARACVAAAALASCSSVKPDDPPQRIIASVLKQLTSENRAICVDARTRGEPLAIFRTMIVAPDQARRPLAWRVPGTLLSPRIISAKRVASNEFSDSRTRLPLAESSTPGLPMVDQIRLNGLAREAMVFDSAEQLPIASPPSAPLAQVRWWPQNRLDSSCNAVHVLTRPVEIRDTAFVAATAGHQGTIFALEQRGAEWVVVAQWANWIY